ncbi:MAG: pectate lyase [Bacteroidales bacterium]|nr:pectate lyase [Bacteroidales bacterium]
MSIRTLSLAALAAAFSLTLGAQNRPGMAPVFAPLRVTQDQQVEYFAYPNGDRIPDYSYCGYMASEEAIPDLLADPTVPVAKVSPSGGDDTRWIQAAVDYIAAQPLRADGFRGVVLLSPGFFRVEGFITLGVSGVVVRGAGTGQAGTTVFAAGHDRETLFQVRGVDDRSFGKRIDMTGEYLPVNSTVIPLPAGHGLKAGDQVTVTRPSTQEWVHLLQADNIGMSADYQHWLWAQDDFDVIFDRTVVAADAASVTVDVPMPMSFDAKYGGGYVTPYTWNGRIDHIGIENMVLVSDYDRNYPKDENHRWMAITFDNAQDCWVRRITARHFVSSLAAVWDNSRRITVEECRNQEPVGEIGGFRRLAFQTLGQQTLFLRCHSEEGYHDFTVGQNAAGPNAFVLCAATSPYDYSGATGGWSCGTLFDRVTVDGAPLQFTNMFLESMGGSWSSANALCWMCRTPMLILEDPPLSHNWAFGTKGQSAGNGSHGNHGIGHPDCLYYYQWEQRTGRKSPELEKIIHYDRIFGEVPDKRVTAEEGVEFGERSVEPAMSVDRWIDEMVKAYPLVATVDRGVSPQPVAVKQSAPELHPIGFSNGRLTIDGKFAAGGTARTTMWQGMLRRRAVRSASDNINRFVPGRTGAGYTDVLDTVVVHLKNRGQIGLQHFPALWYERRRDDHGRMMRANADVWAPFLEQPFARSGEGIAFDRLSKYDLNRWNTWYWDRIAQFAALADRNGLFLLDEHYLQHNIIEEGAHWADYPWRVANNINSDLGFAEPTFMQGDKRVFMATEFYNVENNAALARYHRQYIRKQLDAVKDCRNVIHHLGIEYTGPAHFVRFWLDCIAEWERENAQDVYVMLNATKDVTDEVLADPHYRDLVDIIDIRQWSYGADGSLYAPRGGVNLAPRQYQRVMTQAPSDAQSIWRQITEYSLKYPGIAVVNNAGRAQNSNWVSLAAGASMVSLPQIADKAFYTKVLEMAPMEAVTVDGAQWGMGKPALGYVVYAQGKAAKLDLSADKTSYKARWINPQTGAFVGKTLRVRGGSVVELEIPEIPAPAPAMGRGPVPGAAAGPQGAVLYLSR